MATRKVAASWQAVRGYAAKVVEDNRLDIAMGTYERVWPARVGLKEWPQDGAEAARARREFAAVARAAGCEVVTSNRMSGRVAIESIDAVTIPDEEHLLAISGKEGEIARCRERRELVESGFPWLSAGDLRKAVSALIHASVGDRLFSECCRYGQELHGRDVAGMTPRQVDIEGFHTKWLDSGKNRNIVTLLAGKGDLGLVDRPKHVRFTYLDPNRASLAGRVHDSADSDDPLAAPAYMPEVAVICENRDCAHEFPAVVEHGIAVMGDGDGAASAVAAFPWIAGAPELWYWGDMDADGLEALAAVRRLRSDTKSILMDMESYTRFAHLGVSTGPGGKAIGAREPKDIGELLTASEHELYEHLCSPTCRGPRRIEQERIRFADALGYMGLAPS
ncbi:MAG: Wadjet anti-phage system protein JetD domain-containing protein [Coriobacteriales bacterium]